MFRRGSKIAIIVSTLFMELQSVCISLISKLINFEHVQSIRLNFDQQTVDVDQAGTPSRSDQCTRQQQEGRMCLDGAAVRASDF